MHLFCQCYSNGRSCSSHVRSAERSPPHPPAGSLRNDKHRVGSTAPAAVGPSGTLKTNDNVLGALCRIMKMYPCAPLEFERHQHFKSADPSRRTATIPPSPPSSPPAANGSGGDGEHQSPSARRRVLREARREWQLHFSTSAESSQSEEAMGLSKTGSSGASVIAAWISVAVGARAGAEGPDVAAFAGKRLYLTMCFFTSIPLAFLLSSRASKSAMFVVRVLSFFFVPRRFFSSEVT